jgi:hypothetical protein
MFRCPSCNATPEPIPGAAGLTPADFADALANDLSQADNHYAFSWRTPRLIDRLTR